MILESTFTEVSMYQGKTDLSPLLMHLFLICTNLLMYQHKNTLHENVSVSTAAAIPIYIIWHLEGPKNLVMHTNAEVIFAH